MGNILGALYLAVLFLGIINSRTVQPPASYERSVMYRERAAGMYNELPFALAQCVVVSASRSSAFVGAQAPPL